MDLIHRRTKMKEILQKQSRKRRSAEQKGVWKRVPL